MATTDEQLLDADLAADASRAQLRGRSKRRRQGIGPKGNFAVWTASALAGALLLCGFVTKAAQPYRLEHQQARQIAALKRQFAESNVSNADLERQTAYLKRPDGIENAARAQGFVKPGEVSIEVQATVSPASPSSDRSQGLASILRNAWIHWIK